MKSCGDNVRGQTQTNKHTLITTLRSIDSVFDYYLTSTLHKFVYLSTSYLPGWSKNAETYRNVTTQSSMDFFCSADEDPDL